MGLGLGLGLGLSAASPRPLLPAQSGGGCVRAYVSVKRWKCSMDSRSNSSRLRAPVCECVRECANACVRACVCERACACACVREW